MNSMLDFRIRKLHPKMQEYVYLGTKVGLFNNLNIERVVSRLERVEIGINNNMNSYAHTFPIRTEDENENYVSKGINIDINKDKVDYKIRQGLFYFEDEILFHEFSHAVNGIYEEWFEKLMLGYDVDEKFISTSPIKEDMIKNLSSNPEFRQIKYAGILLDDFVSQTIAQKMINYKYERNIYPDRERIFELSEPPIKCNCSLNGCWQFENVAKKFIESMYGVCDVDQFCIDAIDKGIINKIFSKYMKRKRGFIDLYKILGYMGNVSFSVISKNLDEYTKATDRDMAARNPKKLFHSIKELNGILDKNAEIEKVKMGFGAF